MPISSSKVHMTLLISMKEYQVIFQKPLMMRALQHIVMEKKFFKVTQSINQSTGNVALNEE